MIYYPVFTLFLLLPALVLFTWSKRSLIVASAIGIVILSIYWIGFATEVRREYGVLAWGSSLIPKLLVGATLAFVVMVAARAMAIYASRNGSNRLRERAIDFLGFAGVIAVIIFTQQSSSYRSTKAENPPSAACLERPARVVVSGNTYNVPIRAGVFARVVADRLSSYDLAKESDQSKLCFHSKDGNMRLAGEFISLSNQRRQNETSFCDSDADQWASIMCADERPFRISVSANLKHALRRPSIRFAESRERAPWKNELSRTMANGRVTEYADNFLVLSDNGEKIYAKCWMIDTGHECTSETSRDGVGVLFVFEAPSDDIGSAFVYAYDRTSRALKLLANTE